MPRSGRIALVVVACVALVACRPKTIAQAEAKENVEWLDTNGTPEAVAAMGRLAETSSKALDALNARTAYDVNAYIAAWTAVLRGSQWGSATLRAGLADPARSEAAASVMGRRDAHLVPFVSDLEAALARVAAGRNNVALAAVLASVGAPANIAIQRRLEDPASRGPMCRGIGAPDASPEAKKVLMSVAPASRDNDGCVEAVLKLAQDADPALDWLATAGEPGLLGAAAKNAVFPCARLRQAWTTALARRPASSYSQLTVALENSIKRCSRELDPALSDALRRLPGTHGLIVNAIDPLASETSDLKTTCVALRTIAFGGRDAAIVQSRASDAVSHACKNPR